MISSTISWGSLHSYFGIPPELAYTKSTRAETEFIFSFSSALFWASVNFADFIKASYTLDNFWYDYISPISIASFIFKEVLQIIFKVSIRAAPSIVKESINSL